MNSPWSGLGPARAAVHAAPPLGRLWPPDGGGEGVMGREWGWMREGGSDEGMG